MPRNNRSHASAARVIQFLFIWMFLCVSTTVRRLPFVFLKHVIWAQTRTKINEQLNVVQLIQTCQNTHVFHVLAISASVFESLRMISSVCLVSSFEYIVLCASVFSRNSWTRKSRSLIWSEKIILGEFLFGFACGERLSCVCFCGVAVRQHLSNKWREQYFANSYWGNSNHTYVCPGKLNETTFHEKSFQGLAVRHYSLASACSSF